MRLGNIFAPAILFVTAAHADLTIQYKTSAQFAPGLPPMIADAMKQQLASSIAPTSTLLVHGDKVASISGKLSSIIDYGKRQVTFLHPASKRYATISFDDLPKYLSEILPPPARDAARNVQVDMKVAKSGKTATVGGVPAEEAVINVEMQAPSASVQMRMEVHNWMASPEALTKFPELKQWEAKKWSAAGFNPAELMSGMLSQGPSTEKLRAAMQQLLENSTGLSLKTESRVFMPSMSQMMQAQGIQLGDGPLVSTVMELDHFSADPVAASTFEVPEGYQAAPAADLLQEMNPMKSIAPSAH